MELNYILLGVSLIFSSITVILLINNHKLKRRIVDKEEEIKDLNLQLIVKTEENAINRTILSHKEESFDIIKDENQIFIQKIEQLTVEKYNLQKELELNQVKFSNMQNHFAEWEKLKEESIVNARAAIFSVGNQLSSKLLEDHKREAEEAKKASEKIVKENTEQLYSQFQNIVNSVANINEQVQYSTSSFEKIKRALLSPIGAGSLAEITLENILKSSGLISGKDYIIQFTVNDGENNSLRLRPDAVIFLPSNNIMIIDSKASKYFVNLDDETPEQVISSKIKSVMRTHLKDLINKEYAKSVKEYIEKNYNFKVNYISMVMFLPSEAALEKIQSADEKFIIEAWESNIYPAGPIGIINILSHTKFMISESDKIQNHRHIISQVEKLLQSIGKVYEYAGKIGLNLQTTMKNFDRLAASLNSSLAPRIKNLEKLGLNTASQLKFKKLDRLQFIQTNELNFIEIEESTLSTDEIEEIEV